VGGEEGRGEKEDGGRRRGGAGQYLNNCHGHLDHYLTLILRFSK